MTSHDSQTRAELITEAANLATAAGAPPMQGFLQDYYRHVPVDELRRRTPEDLLSLAVGQRELARHRPAGTASVRCFNPTLDADGWTSSHTVVQIVTDDMPFLVDSVNAVLATMNRPVHLVIHPVLQVERDATGDLVGIIAGDAEAQAGRAVGVLAESWMHVEIDRESHASDRDEIEGRLRAALSDVREAVEDWPKMQARARQVAADITADPPAGIDDGEAHEAVELLAWLADNHFTFLAARDYRLGPVEGGTGLIPVPGSGLGLLRSDPPMGQPRPPLNETVLRKAREPRLVFVTKANSRATVHRPVYMDYVGVKTFDEHGTVVGERRFLGLFTASAYAESILRVPFLADKVTSVLRTAGYSEGSHSAKDLLGIFEEYPRDELFQADGDQLLEVATSVLNLAEKHRTRVFLRPDDYGRFVSALVFIPRDRYNTAVRLSVESILREAVGAVGVEYTTRVSESHLAQVHYVLRLEPGTRVPDVDVDALEARIAAATRTWDEDFAGASVREFGEEEAARLVSTYAGAFPTAYKEDFEVRQGVADLHHLEALPDPDSTRMVLYKPRWKPDTERRFKIFRREQVTLTRVLPLFTDMGVEVVDERPYEVARADGTRLHVYDFGLRVRDGAVWSSMTHARLRELFEDAVAAVWAGRAESDGFNTLVLRSQLTWRQVVILRTIAKYLRQTRPAFSENYLQNALIHNWRIAADLVALFEARFDPAGSADDRPACEEAIAERIVDALDSVTSLDEDRIIRAFLGVIRATLRTNYYQRDAHGAPKAYVSLKLDPQKVPELPAPRPAYEIWVYSPRVEGVHLRFGPVARGGLRWSDRRDDFRTEVLGLVKAQMVKNAVIVPTGSKGGFFAKQLPDNSDRDAWLAEGIASYRIFISGLLDLTDNRVSDEVVPPADVVRHDGDDPYLVVAADKGTASFSDIANSVSQDYGFWLDDAFASGGSSGYDHKGMGITARGAWESVKRHFREFGHDTQTEDFTTVGIGDMSGDVFGNGMLLSHHIRLIAAFDHRHVFLDPNPVAATSFAERQRLFDLPRSSWGDYDTAVISEGGGVYPRTAKSVPITAPVAEALGIDSGVRAMTPAELIHAILLAPADLLWNGGIGTYVKASTESNGEIGDRANDAIRVDGRDLRVRVVGEGGNLGFSQHGRIEAARHGIRINTDAIDNSAGVDTSDHEVNIKILLSQVVRDGDLTLKQRNEILASMTDDVAHAVLRDNYEQNVLLGNARAQQFAMVPVHQRLIHELEDRGDLNRELEFLPSDVELAKRAEEQAGLSSPEFSVLVAYAKLALKHDLLQTTLPDDPWLEQTLRGYFPPLVGERFPGAVDAHPLKREIITTAIANSLVNRGGITFAFRAAEETGATTEQIARAFVIAREIFGAAGYLSAVEALDNQVGTDVQTDLYLELRRLLDRAVRWLVVSRPAGLDLSTEIARFRPIIAEWAPKIPDFLVGSERERLDRNTAARVEQGVPEDIAARRSALLDCYSLLDIVEIATETGHDPSVIIPLYFQISERLGVDNLLGKITLLSRENRWDSLARGALRDDLYGILEGITRSVLAGAEPGSAGPEDLIEHWLDANRDSLERAHRSLRGIDRMDRPGISALSVALRVLRTVVKSGSADH
ncbi:NAD-glutamate dehydrogenase [Nostocoides vanveenii]